MVMQNAMRLYSKSASELDRTIDMLRDALASEAELPRLLSEKEAELERCKEEMS